MKTHRAGLLFIPVVLSIIAAAKSPQARDPLQGVWNYASPGRGQAIYHDGRFMMFTLNLDSAPGPGALDEAAQARLYRTLTLQAGTYSIDDTLVTMRMEYNKDPRASARTWRWSSFLKGDTLTWHVLNAAGQATSIGKSIRVR